MTIRDTPESVALLDFLWARFGNDPEYMTDQQREDLKRRPALADAEDKEQGTSE